MARYQSTVWCDGCGVEIVWAPQVMDARDFCCQTCADGGACRCGERMEMDERRRAAAGEGVAVDSFGGELGG